MADALRRVISRRHSFWQKALAFVPALLLLAYLPGQMMLRCRIDGLLRTACCCSHQDQERPSGPAIKAQSCCDQEVSDSQRPKADVARSPGRDFAPLVALAVVAPSAPVILLPVVRSNRAAQRHGPAREGPPLVLLKHAFLI
jgi:hypothetical protein